MLEKNNNANRKKEIVDICLNEFMEKGLYKTSARDLGNALNMQVSALYYYFKNKDEIVVECAEEAGLRLEQVLILPVMGCLDDEAHYRALIEEKEAETTPMMRFFAQVCTTNEYREAMQPVIDRMKKRHREYAVRMAERYHCEPEALSPYLCACVAIVSNHMIFGESFYYEKPIELIVDAVRAFSERRREQEARKEAEWDEKQYKSNSITV